MHKPRGLKFVEAAGIIALGLYRWKCSPKAGDNVDLQFAQPSLVIVNSLLHMNS